MRPLWPPMYRREWTYTALVAGVGLLALGVHADPAATQDQFAFLAVAAAAVGIGLHLEPEREPPEPPKR